jgi:branched-chain amino acid transport system ATP-binding protein
VVDVCLRAVGICKNFGRVEALSDIDVELELSTIHGVVGPNGAGKTTLLNIISGFVTPGRGRIEVGGVDVTRLSPQQRVPLGVVRTFQNIRLFGGLSVLQNVLIGQHVAARTGLRSLVPWRNARDRGLRAQALHALDLFGLTAYRDRLASDLPYGLQKQLEMARALAAQPRILLLDEPAAGMTADGRQELADHILLLRQNEGISIIVVEHDMDVIAKVCDTVTVLSYGRTLIAGSPGDVLASDDVRTAYLGN